MKKNAVLGINSGSFFYGEKSVFENVTFNIDKGFTSLVGDNGAGKTTLIKCLLGDEELSFGELVKSNNTRIAYLPQTIPSNYLSLPVRELYIQKLDSVGIDEEWKADMVLSELGIAYEDWNKPLEQFSGGWQRLILIAAATNIEEPNVIILDEPTNHLDISNMYRLEKWLLNNAKCPVLLVSHDREFLNKVTDKTLFLRKDGAYYFKASFSKAREELFQRDVANARAYELEEKEIKRLTKVAQRYNQWCVKNDKFAKKQRATENRIERIKDNRTSTHNKKDRALSLHEGGVEANVLLRIIDFDVKTPDGRLLYHIDKLYLKKGDCIALLGDNGAGKTTLVNAIFEKYDPDLEYYDGKADIRFNPKVKLAYFDQKNERMPEDMSLIDYIMHFDIPTKTEAIAELANAGFPYPRIDSKISTLSFGEKSRLLFLAIKLSKPNMYMLDEPTNHLDIEGQEKLEDDLENKECCCILVSHDRYFTRQATNRFFEIKNGKLIEVDSPDEFFERQQLIDN